MANLTDHRAAPRSGETKSLVILLHGYGADGADLFGLSQPLADFMPDTVFRAPNAPETNAVNPGGFQWFPIPWLDGSTDEQRKTSMDKSITILNDYLTEVMTEEGVTPDQTALIGFSQGTMMSLYVAPRREAPFACVVGFSGRLVDERLAEDTRVRPPVLLVHGDQDPMIPVADMSTAETALRAAGFDVASHISRGVGHSIAPDGLTLALQFMMRHLGIAPQ